LSPLSSGEAILDASRHAKNSSREFQHLALASLVGVGSASCLSRFTEGELEKGHMNTVSMVMGDGPYVN
jgi:hypothetical protein